MNDQLQDVYDAVLDGDTPGTEAMVRDALAAGERAEVILNQAMIPALEEVGQLFEDGEYYLAEMLVSARAMQAGVALLRPHLLDAKVESAGKVVIGTVKGDMHDIGKNLVGMMLEGAGYEVTDLGTDVAPQRFIAAIEEGQAQVIALSALLTTTMSNMKVTLDAFNAAGVRGRVKVIVGGAPVTESYAQQIGADGYTADASQVVPLVRALLAA
jgi:5-methyltetrahydrofolate--homocysteine methyltransferase